MLPSLSKLTSKVLPLAAKILPLISVGSGVRKVAKGVGISVFVITLWLAGTSTISLNLKCALEHPDDYWEVCGITNMLVDRLNDVTR